MCRIEQKCTFFSIHYVNGTVQDKMKWFLPKCSEKIQDHRLSCIFMQSLTILLALTVGTLRAKICRRELFLKGVGHFYHPLKVEGDVAHQPLLGGRKLEGLPFHIV